MTTEPVGLTPSESEVLASEGASPQAPVHLGMPPTLMEYLSTNTGTPAIVDAEMMTENEAFDEVLSEIDSTRSVDLAPSGNPISVVNLQGQRKSTRLLKI